jgi:2-polyprenyl-3-methyl-5-hydroxy-6-metoxy-1,4-benzoquinol methylase
MTAIRDLGLPVRQRTPEIMDDPGLDPRAHVKALRGLERINRASRTAAAMWAAIARLDGEPGTLQRPLHLMDVACGGGIVPLAVARLAERRGQAIDVAGCDKSPRAVEFATRRARETGRRARFFVHNMLAEPLPERYDIVTCSLFLHHLDEAEGLILLEHMAAAAERLLLVDDLVRGPAGYVLAWIGCRALSRSRVVHADGPASVAAAYTIDEARALARRAGLEQATISRHWPERFLLSWRRP